MTGAFGGAALLILKMAICAVIAFAGGWWILSAWFDRRLTGLEVLLLTAGLLAIMVFSVPLAMSGGPGVLVLLGVVVGSGWLFRTLARRAEAKLTERLDEKEIAKYQEAVRTHPGNPHAHSLLGDTYRHIGDLELAIEQYQAAVTIDPSLKQERYWLERLRAEVERRERKEMSCPQCGEVRPKRASVCPECGRAYSTLETWAHAYRVLGPGERAAVGGLVLAALAIIAATALLAPKAFKLMAVAALVAGPIAIIIQSVRGQRRTG